MDVILSILMVSLPVLFNVNVEFLTERMNTPPKLTKAGITEMLDISGFPVPLTYIVSGEDRALLAMITEALAQHGRQDRLRHPHVAFFMKV